MNAAAAPNKNCSLDRNFYLRDRDLYLRALRFSAKKGVPEAQYNLGWHYYAGEGVRRNYKTAHKWFKLAAGQGLAEASPSPLISH